MTSRERWTVYPLLLAIGLAMRPGEDTRWKYKQMCFPQLLSDAVRFLVEADDGTVLLHMGRVVDGGGGRIEVKDASGENTVAIGTRPDEEQGRIEFLIQKAVFELFLTELIKNELLNSSFER